MASTASGTSPWPVMSITGMPTLSSFSRRNRSMPLISGILISVMMQPTGASGNASRKVLAESKLRTSSCAARSKNARDSRSPSSSSMICTTGCAAAFSEAIAAFLLAYGRQCEAKDGAAPWIWPWRDRAAMRFDDGARNRQTDSHALAFGGDEWLKQLIGNLRCDSRAGIRDTDFDHVTGGEGGRNHEFAYRGGLHRVDRVADKIKQDLLNLHLVRKHIIEPWSEGKAHADALVLSSDQRQCARFFNQLFNVLDTALALAARDEVTQPADDVARPQGLIRCFFHGVAHRAQTLILAIFQKPARSLHVIGNRSQRLIELVGQSRGHFAHRSEARHVNKLGLQFLQARFGLLTFGKIPDETGEKTLLADVHFADSQFYWKSRAVAPLTDHDPPDANDAPLTGAQVTRDVAVMILAVRRRHQHLDVLPQHIGRGIAEQPFRRRAERLDQSELVDHHHSVGNAVENRLQVRGTRLDVLSPCVGDVPKAQQNCAAPRHGKSHQREYQPDHGVGGRQLARLRNKKETECDAQRSRKQSRSPAAQCRGNQNRRDKQYVRGFPAQH